jgi:heme A synthase
MDLSTLVSLAVFIIILVAIVWLLIWAIDTIGPPDPIRKVARVLIIVFAVLIVIYRLLPLANVGIH